MASIKQLSDRRYKITISNGYRNGKKICKSQTIQVPKSVALRSIRQYVMHEAEELERRFKYGFSEDGSTTFVSAVLSDAKRNEIIQKNLARMIDLPTASHTDQHIPSVEDAQHLLQALAREPRHFRVFYLLAMATGCRRGELCVLRWSDFRTRGNGFILTVSRSRSIVAGKGVVEGGTKNGHSRQIILSCSAWCAAQLPLAADTGSGKAWQATQSVSVRQLGREAHPS